MVKLTQILIGLPSIMRKP